MRVSGLCSGVVCKGVMGIPQQQGNRGNTLYRMKSTTNHLMFMSLSFPLSYFYLITLYHIFDE